MTDLRPSYAERDAYLERLAESYAEGRLDDLEYDRRRDALLAGVTHQDMLQQFQGLPHPGVLEPQRQRFKRARVVKPNEAAKAQGSHWPLILAAVVAGVVLFIPLGLDIWISSSGSMEEDYSYSDTLPAADTGPVVEDTFEKLQQQGFTHITELTAFDGSASGSAVHEDGTTSGFSFEQDGSHSIWSHDGPAVTEESAIPIAEARIAYDAAIEAAAGSGLEGTVTGSSYLADGGLIQVDIENDVGTGYISVEPPGRVVELRQP